MIREALDSAEKEDILDSLSDNDEDGGDDDGDEEEDEEQDDQGAAAASAGDAKQDADIDLLSQSLNKLKADD